MKVIKLDAIDSTNDFLKDLNQDQELESYTVVAANKQTKGKGQMGAVWHSEEGKNLTMSVLIKESVLEIENIFCLNMTIALSIIEALKKLKIVSLSIKWPNDIMAENKKIAGILIENTIKENSKIDSIVGIGLNVNQTNFDGLPKASSLKNIMGCDFNVDQLLEIIVLQIKENVEELKSKKIDFFWEQYESILFKKGKPTLFENIHGERFMGIIEGVNKDGKLRLLLENDTVNLYGIKEISMIF
jgi:BirA family transcriptional regulator, biotin operon repressor / biotin---[acetyl-CoA-carboxylase] ligase